MRAGMCFKNGVLAMLLSATVSHAEVLYSTQNCAVNPLANYWHCQPFSTSFATDAPTQTENEVFRNFSYENQLALLFQCKASQAFSAEYKIGDAHAFLAPTQIATVQTLVSPVSYEGKAVSLSLSPPYNAIVLPGCRLEIVSNLTSPALNEVKRYADSLGKSIDDQINTTTQLMDAATLPAKWVVVRDLSTRLKTQRDFKDLQRDALVAERDSLQAVEPSARTPVQQLRLEQLTANGGPLDQLELEIADLDLLRTQLDGAMPANDPCSVDGSSPNAFCLSKVEQAKAAIDAELTRQLQAAQSLAEFLQAEIGRLAQRAQAITTKLTEILNALKLRLEGT